VTIVTWDSVAAAQDGEQNQRANDGNDDRAKTAEAVREESEHRPISSGDTPSVSLSSSDGVELNVGTTHRRASFDPVV
jgi:hypothetical protein